MVCESEYICAVSFYPVYFLNVLFLTMTKISPFKQAKNMTHPDYSSKIFD